MSEYVYTAVDLTRLQLLVVNVYNMSYSRISITQIFFTPLKCFKVAVFDMYNSKNT